MTAQEIEANATKMLDALNDEHRILLDAGNYKAAAAIHLFTTDTDTVTLARLAAILRATDATDPPVRYLVTGTAFDGGQINASYNSFEAGKMAASRHEAEGALNVRLEMRVSDDA